MQKVDRVAGEDTAVCLACVDDEEAEEDEAEAAGKARKKKPWRYRWPEATRDEVLARLLQLNQERAAEGALARPKTTAKKKGAVPRA